MLSGHLAGSEMPQSVIGFADYGGVQTFRLPQRLDSLYPLTQMSRILITLAIRFIYENIPGILVCRHHFIYLSPNEER